MALVSEARRAPPVLALLPRCAGGSGGVVLAVVGLVPLAAGTFGLCLLDPLFGVSLNHRPPSASAR